MSMVLNQERLGTIRHWLQDRKPQSIERLKRWCDTNSSSYDSDRLRRMADLLAEDFRNIGVEFTSIELPPISSIDDAGHRSTIATGPALLWNFRPEATRRVLLMIHYDTVYRSDDEPSICHVEANCMVGPGTADAKGGIATIYTVVEALGQFKILSRIGLSVLLNPDEEIGSPASRQLMKELAPEFDAALLFEPALPDGSLVRARKGSGNFDCWVKGRSAHAGRDLAAGRNAIMQAARLVIALTELNAPELGIQVNVGRISGGGPLNRVPDMARVQLNVRVESRETLRHTEAALAQLASQYSRDGFEVEIHGEFHAPPKIPDSQFYRLQKIVDRASALVGDPIQWLDTGGACDGSKLTAYGLANVDSLGPRGQGLHSPSEYCELDSLVPAALRVIAILSLLDAETSQAV